MGDVLPRETENTVYRYLIAISKLRLGILTAIKYKTKGVRTFGSTAAEIVCRGATLNTLSSFGFNCVYYALRVEG